VCSADGDDAAKRIFTILTSTLHQLSRTKASNKLTTVTPTLTTTPTTTLPRWLPMAQPPKLAQQLFFFLRCCGCDSGLTSAPAVAEVLGRMADWHDKHIHHGVVVIDRGGGGERNR